MSSETITVEIWRGKEEGEFQTYQVPRMESQTVLDIVTYVQRNLDPGLSYRFACRVGVCGSCAMTVNGKPRWTCRTHIDKVAGDGTLRIQPLRNLPVIRDLAVDMTDFFEKWTQAKAQFVPTATRADDFAQVSPEDPQRKEASAGIECINCGVCYSACDTVAWVDDYLGPAALNRAWTLHNDVRDGGRAERLKAISGAGGCQACHSHQSCFELCPKHLNPTASIAGLKRATVKAALKGEI
ncbi:MAG: succinate dehydrogenase/fumarate reductase iron-sulfur subunit [Rhodospirillaceae bacterium]|nr:succinate dehydrogenase/fumarate reductase iron-sulfur subunit [Rhodospirillaceae bacterium]